MVESEYAKALYELALEEKKLEKINEYFDALIYISKNDDFIKVMTSPVINKNDKKKIIETSFKKFDLTFINFLYVLIDKNRFNVIHEIYNEFKELINDKLHIKNAIIYSAKELNQAQLKELENILEKKYKNKQIVIENIIDSNLIAGVRVVVDNEAIDLSLKHSLLKLKESL